MHNHFKYFVGTRTESLAYVYLNAIPVDPQIESIEGKIIGPHCQFSRTLPAEFAFTRANHPLSDSLVLESLIIDPCYWTPALPFLYNLELQLQMRDGKKVAQSAKVGLRRWDYEGTNFRMQCRRVVLRGTSCDQLTSEIIQHARTAETSLLVDRYDPQFCATTDQQGVIVVLDLRSTEGTLDEIFRLLDWLPSVFLALVNAEQLARPNFNHHWPKQCHLAQCLTAISTPDELTNFNTEALAVELAPGERPPTWLASIDRPVIVIRRGEDYADLVAARAACDRLQAELAPEFDLAGYFVAP